MKKLFVIGDSISCYYGRHLEGFLKGVMAYDRKGGTNVLKELDDCTDGVNGGDSSMVLTYVKAVVKQDWFKPDILLFNCGGHDRKLHLDGKLQIPPDQYVKNLRQVIAILRAKPIALVWCRSTPLNPARTERPPEAKTWHRKEDLDHYIRLADEIMAAANIPVIDLYTFTCNLGPDIYLNGTDHTHLNERAAALQAAFIAGSLTALAAAGKI